MKIRIDIFRLAVAALAAAVIIYGLSCSSGNGKATPLLETADSLMASDPQAARQVLSGLITCCLWLRPIISAVSR